MKNHKINPETIEERRRLMAAFNAAGDGERAATVAGLVALRNTEGHVLSERNKFILALQASRRGLELGEMVGGFRQWRRLGRAVRKGERALMVCFPRVGKADNGDWDVLRGFSWGCVFAYSQTVPAGAAGAAGAGDDDGGGDDGNDGGETVPETVPAVETAPNVERPAAAVVVPAAAAPVAAVVAAPAPVAAPSVAAVDIAAIMAKFRAAK